MSYTKKFKKYVGKYLTMKEDIAMVVLAIIVVGWFTIFAAMNYDAVNRMPYTAFMECAILCIGSSVTGRFMLRVMKNIQKDKNNGRMSISVVVTSVFMVSFYSRQLWKMTQQNMPTGQIVVWTLITVLIIYAMAWAYVTICMLAVRYLKRKIK